MAQAGRSGMQANERRARLRIAAWSCVALLLASAVPSTEIYAQDDRVLMAIFAHPDDEGLVGPVLARYAREGVNVILVIATDGRLGTNDFSGLSAGDGLAAIRRDEAKCAASTLGVDLIHLDYYDQFNAAQGYDGFIPQLQGLIRDLDRIIREHQPDAIITFGPDGVSNHMDHRLVGSSVTQVFVSQEWDKSPALYYFGLPASTVAEEDRVLRGVQEKYLTVRVPYADDDGKKALEALECHESQIPPESIERRRSRMEERENIIHFRPFTPPTGHSNDLFHAASN